MLTVNGCILVTVKLGWRHDLTVLAGRGAQREAMDHHSLELQQDCGILGLSWVCFLSALPTSLCDCCTKIASLHKATD